MAYKVIILYQLYMPSYFLGTFTEYPSIKYLAKNLRTCGVCKIALDIPKTGDYHFKCMKEAQE